MRRTRFPNFSPTHCQVKLSFYQVLTIMTGSEKKSSESSQVFWMGGNDLATENRWAWASNGRRIYPYVNWASAPSTPTGKRCIALKGPDLLWSPEDCQATKARFICEASKHIEYLLVSKKIIIHNEIALCRGDW